MDNLKNIIAKNISDLRKNAGMTQIELAEKLNYSDKAVSKWERGDSVPDVSVIKQISDLFGVTVDYLLTEDPVHPSEKEETLNKTKNHLVIALLSMMTVWTVATLIFVILGMIPWETMGEPLGGFWLVFVYALPVSAIVLLVFNSIWGNRRRNYLAVSVLVWGIIAAVFLTLTVLHVKSDRLWMIILLGIPAQIIIILWSKIHSPRKPRKKTDAHGTDTTDV